jgi:hypothetical protein
MRTDFEEKFYKLTKDELIRGGQNGTHRIDYFNGHCTGEGGSSYQHIHARQESFQKVAALYN